MLCLDQGEVQSMGCFQGGSRHPTSKHMLCSSVCEYFSWVLHFSQKTMNQKKQLWETEEDGMLLTCLQQAAHRCTVRGRARSSVSGSGEEAGDRAPCPIRTWEHGAASCPDFAHGYPASLWVGVKSCVTLTLQIYFCFHIFGAFDFLMLDLTRFIWWHKRQFETPRVCASVSRRSNKAVFTVSRLVWPERLIPHHIQNSYYNNKPPTLTTMETTSNTVEHWVCCTASPEQCKEQ